MKKTQLSGVRSLVLLLVWFLIVEAVYYACISFYFEQIVLVYIVLFSAAAVLFLLVNGGVRPLIADERKKEESVHKKYLADKRNENKNKRKNRREKYKKYTVMQPDEVKAKEEEKMPRLNIFNLSDERRIFYTKALLIFGIPLFLAVSIDYLLLMFGFSFT